MDFPGGFFGHEQAVYHGLSLVTGISKRSSSHEQHYSKDLVNLGRVTQDNFSRACRAYWSCLVACHTLAEHFTVPLAWNVPQATNRLPEEASQKWMLHVVYIWANRGFGTPLELL